MGGAMRANRRTISTAAVLLLALALPRQASAGSGRDPNDARGDRFDIALVSVRTGEEPSGVAVYAIRLRTYRGFRLRDCGCVFAVVLDGRGDRRGDLAVVIRGRTDGPRLIGQARQLRGEFRHVVVVHKDAWRSFRIVIPRDWLSPTRAVRFRATARADGTADRAPNAGRYEV
jgi:hypothetical protein